MEFTDFQMYHPYNFSAPTIEVKMGSMLLVKQKQYSMQTTQSEPYDKIAITGMGIAEGFEKVFYSPELKRNLAEADINADKTKFKGEPVSTSISVRHEISLDLGEDFQVIYIDNVNMGTATAQVIGIGNCYGESKVNFQITTAETRLFLPGTYIGMVDGELSDDITVEETILTPGVLDAWVNYSGIHVAGYALYRVEEESITLVEERASDVGYWDDTAFVYDFTSVYEDAADVGGEIYLLSYSWVTDEGKVYGGAMILYIPAKVPQATSMTMYRVENDGDFRKDYLNLVGFDGALDDITWTSSNTSVATVENGVVTFQKPGDEVITGSSGQLQESYRFTVESLDITEGFIFDYAPDTGTARVIYDNRLLDEGVDYTLSVKNDTVTVTGRGLFTGELEKTFDGVDALADPHTHGFDNSCDKTCNSCEYTRTTDHKYLAQWCKDETHHWHECTGCGDKKDHATHDFSAADPSVCTVCGPMYTAGDLNGDSAVNEDDAIYLLQHVLLPEFFPIAQDADYNGDSKINEDDAIYLLQHVLLPDFFPL